MDFPGVQSNLKLLREFLDEVGKSRSGEDPNVSLASSAVSEQLGGMVWVIFELKKEIYSEIDRYMSDCFVVLCDVFKTRNRDLTMMTKLFLSRQSFLSEKERTYLNQLLDDIAYLKEMKQLEQDTQQRSMHIVPVSGLAIGRMVRLEQEMRTVCEVWGDRLNMVKARKKISRVFLPHVESASEEDEVSDSVLLVDDVEMSALRELCNKLIGVVPVSDREFKMVTYSSCFLGCECVDTLIRQELFSRPAAVSICSDLFNCGYIEPVVRGMPFVDGFEFYRWSPGGPRSATLSMKPKSKEIIQS